MTGRGVFMPRGVGREPMCLYHYAPGDCYCEIGGLGIAVRHSNGEVVLIGPGTPGHKLETNGLKLDWTAACI